MHMTRPLKDHHPSPLSAFFLFFLSLLLSHRLSLPKRFFFFCVCGTERKGGLIVCCGSLRLWNIPPFLGPLLFFHPLYSLQKLLLLLPLLKDGLLSLRGKKNEYAEQGESMPGRG